MGWKQTRFDHASTKFPLVGRHVKVACAACHPSQRYKNTPTDCVSCHRLDDAHQGRFGPACADCHSAKGWKVTGFDHDRDTHFPLRGAHHGLSCQPGNPFSEVLVQQPGCDSGCKPHHQDRGQALRFPAAARQASREPDEYCLPDPQVSGGKHPGDSAQHPQRRPFKLFGETERCAGRGQWQVNQESLRRDGRHQKQHQQPLRVRRTFGRRFRFDFEISYAKGARIGQDEGQSNQAQHEERVARRPSW